MQRIKGFAAPSIWKFIFLLFISGSFAAAQPIELSNKISFLRGEGVRMSDINGQNTQKLTNDSDKVDAFLFSPTLKYLAYSKIIGFADEPGLWDDTTEVPQRAIYSIVILDLKTKKVLKEIKPTRDPWIYMVKWLSDEELFYSSSDGFAVNGYFIYNIHKNIEEEVGYDRGAILLNTDYSVDRALAIYVDDTGVGKSFMYNLHLVDLPKGLDKILISRRGTITDQRISNDKKRIAFIEVENKDQKYYDNLWVLDIHGSACISLYRGPAKAKAGGVNHLGWSYDDQYVGIFFPPEAVVIEVQNPAKIHRIQGADFSWLENKKILFAKGNSIYFYEIGTRKFDLLLENAADPMFLK